MPNAVVWTDPRGPELDQQISREQEKRKEAARRPPSLLTPRQLEVLRLIADGHKMADVAKLLGITLSAALEHRGNINKRLNTSSVALLTRYAIRIGLTKP